LVEKEKKHIPILRTPHGLAITHEDKEAEIACHFSGLLGSKLSGSVSLKWNKLDYPWLDLVDLESDITDEEIKCAISDMPKENVPGPDGFIRAFYSECWEINMSDVCQAVR
jgi:hypothetical protein